LRRNNAILKMRKIYKLTYFIFILFSFTSCEYFKTEELEYDKTTLQIEDPYRKYFPVIQGQDLNIMVRIYNIGDNTLKIFNVLPSCSCVVVEYPKSIAPGMFGVLQIKFNSLKNIGHVGIYTAILANTKQYEHTFYFETNVVPDALYIKDYEELYYLKNKEDNSNIDVRKLVEGDANNKGYIIDSTEARRFR